MTLLMLDYDGEIPDDFEFRLRYLSRVCQWGLPLEVRLDKTRRGWHGLIQVNRALSYSHTVAAQAILGSHWCREAHNLQRALIPESQLPDFWRARRNVLYSQHDHSRAMR
jgi:hypothetical protein